MDGGDERPARRPGTRVAARLVPWLALAVVPLLAVGPALARGELLLPWLPAGLAPLASDHPAEAARAFEDPSYVTGDRVFPALTDQLAAAGALARGELPLWEPDLGLGVPLFGQSMAGLAYPPNALALALGAPPDAAAAPLALLSLALAGLGAWLFLGRRGLAPGAALVGAVALQAGGFALANLLYPMKLDAALWLPWQLWAIEGVFARRRFAGLALAGAATLSLLAGFVPLALFALATSTAYAFARGFGLVPDPAGGDELAPGPARAFACTGLLVLGVGGASVQVLPMSAASAASVRQERSIESLEAESLPLGSALSLVVPELFGAPGEPPAPRGDPLAWWVTPGGENAKAENANGLEWNLSLGAVVLALAVAGVIARPRRAAFPAGLALAAVGFAQGWPVVRWLYALPGLDLGAPARVASVAWVLAAWLAALGAHALLTRRERALPALLLVVVLSAGGALWFGARLAADGFPARLQADLAERWAPHGVSAADVRAVVPADAIAAAGERAWTGARRAAGLSALLALAAAVSVALGRRRPDEARPAWPLLVALFAQGWALADVHVVSHAPGPEGLFPANGQGVSAVAAAAGDGRVVRFDPTPSGVADVAALARPNLLEAYGVADLTPYVIFTPRSLVELLGAADPRARYRSGISRVSTTEVLASPVLDLLRVTCVLSREPLAHPRLEPVLERPGFCVYRRSGAWPRARVAADAIVAESERAALVTLGSGLIDPGRTLLTTDPGAPRGGPGGGELRVDDGGRSNSVAVEVTGTGGGWLVLHEQWAAGWIATLDGEPVPVRRADHVYRAVRLPPGDHRVEFTYAPATVRGGALLSLVALALAGALSLGLGRR